MRTRTDKGRHTSADVRFPSDGRRGRRNPSGSYLAAAFLILATIAGGAAHGIICSVPSTGYPTIQSAIDDPACTLVEVAAGTFQESPIIDRTLSIHGLGSTATYLAGPVEVTAGTVELQDLGIVSPPGSTGETFWAHSGAEVTALGLAVVHGSEIPLFADGFESGDTTAWSSTS